MFSTLVDNYPSTYKCVEKMSNYLKNNCGYMLSEEEQLYLILHVNRLKIGFKDKVHLSLAIKK